MKNIIIVLCCIAFISCKKEQPSVTKTEKILLLKIAGASSTKTHDVSCTDYTGVKNPADVPAPFFSITNSTENKTYELKTYQGASLSVDYVFRAVPSNATITATVDGVILNSNRTQVGNSGAFYITIP